MSVCFICTDSLKYIPSVLELEAVDPDHLHKEEKTLKVATTNCGHHFHLCCVSDWIGTSEHCNCPVCDNKVTRDSVSVIYNNWTDATTSKYVADGFEELEYLKDETFTLENRLFNSKIDNAMLREELRGLGNLLGEAQEDKTKLAKKLREKTKGFDSSPTQTAALKRKSNKENFEATCLKRMTIPERSNRDLFSIENLLSPPTNN